MRIILIMLSTNEQRALRWVLMLSFERAELARLVFEGKEEEVERWPSSQYAVAAELLGRRGSACLRVRAHLERRLAMELARNRQRSLAELSSTFRDAASSASTRELAAILWILVERRNASALRLCERLALEVEVVAARGLLRRESHPSYLSAPRSPEADRLSAIG